MTALLYSANLVYLVDMFKVEGGEVIYTPSSSLVLVLVG